MKFLILFALLQVLGIAGWLNRGYPWVRFASAQLFQLEVTVVGWFLLIPFCLAQAWEMSPVLSIKDGSRRIDRWRWRWLGLAFDNPEDGVSGDQAQVWVNGELKPYMPNAWLRGGRIAGRRGAIALTHSSTNFHGMPVPSRNGSCLVGLSMPDGKMRTASACPSYPSDFPAPFVR